MTLASVSTTELGGAFLEKEIGQYLPPLHYLFSIVREEKDEYSGITCAA